MTATLTHAPSDRVGAISAPVGVSATQRDPRLDFYRGLAMFIILIAHTPGNMLTRWIPARFGFSDATEIFVFCSGMASAIAFGRVFREQGRAMGTARVAFRVWQVYWAHIGLFFAIAMAMAALNATGVFARDYVGQLNLYPFFNNPEQNLIGLMTLTYVPNYFDILPMYLAILAMMPLMVILAGLHRGLMFGAMALLWLIAQEGLWELLGMPLRVELPAEPWSDREWFFNPFGWQLVFFTGFAFMIGWLPAPPRDRRLAALALLIVLAIIPLAWFRLIMELPDVQAWRSANRWLFAKTDFGILRYVHFLALAYLGWYIAGAKGENLLPRGDGWAARLWQKLLTVILKVGQQSLAVFVFSMLLARFMGLTLDVFEWNRRDFSDLAPAAYYIAIMGQWAVNLAGFAILIGVAYTAAWFKSTPWRKKRAAS